MGKRNIYRQAIDVQNASNPSGVIHTLAEEILPGVQAEPGYREQGTRYLNENPALILFMFKLADMFGIAYLSGDSISHYGDMEDECLKRAETAEALEAIVEAICD